MNKIYKNKKIIIISAIALSLLVVFVVSSNFADAQQLNLPGIPAAGVGLGAAAKSIGVAAGLSILKTGLWAVGILGFLVLLQHALWWFIGFGYSLLNSAVNVALDPNWFRIDAVIQGWQLVRDFVNVWFILVFLIIAIGTILRSSSYQAKKLLPTLILMALVVNFSMPISKFVIDISNVISFQFLQAICPEIKNETGTQYCDFAGNLENGLDVKGFTQAIKESVEAVPKEETTPQENPKVPFNDGNELIPKAHAFAFVPILIIAAKWIGPTVAFFAFESIASYFTTTSFGGVSVGTFVSALTTNVFLLFTAFVILAIAILFLIRIISLVFLVVISPFGFAAMILPATQKHATEWWSKLFTQSFFAPFVLFFLWMSLNLINNMKSAFTINGIPYDFTNPVNARLMFYIFSIIMLYASLWIARKMGAIGAETIIKWGNTARSAITGFVGGLAARNLWAPIGAAGIAKGIPETLAKIPFVGPLAGITAAEALKKIAKAGKAPEKAAEKAELGMRLAPAERGAYFAKLDRAAKEAMLRKMKGDDRESLMAGLSASDKEKEKAAAQEARGILGSYAYTGEEQLKTAAEEFKYKNILPEQWKKFGTLSENVRKQFVLGIDDADKRAQFLQKVKENATEENGGLDAFNIANEFLEKSPSFSSNQKYANMLARYKTEHTEKQKLNEFASFFENIGDENEQKARFKFATNELQKLELFEEFKNKPELLKKLQGWINETDPMDQDKLYRDYIGKRASSESVVAFIRAVNTGKPERDKAIKKMILSGASAAQLGVLYRDNKDDTELLSTIDEYVITMTEQNQKVFTKNMARLPGGPGPSGTTGGGAGPTGGAPTPVTPVTPVTPASPTTQATPTSSTTLNINEELRRINALDRSNDADAIQLAIETISKNPQFENLRKRINVYTDFAFIETGDKTPQKFREYLEKTITESSPTELHYKIDVNAMKQNDVKVAVMQKINREQLARLVGDGERAEIMKNLLHNPDIFYGGGLVGENSITERVMKEENTTLYGARNIILKDPELYSQAIAETFEFQYKNKELGEELSRIMKSQNENLGFADKIIKERLFE